MTKPLHRSDANGNPTDKWALWCLHRALARAKQDARERGRSAVVTAIDHALLDAWHNTHFGSA